ncbi:uncharacterized protein SOCE26_005400 [Sorangium cellulosum]|uniref:Uncharacterized protein n=1 Tax=Sorangium cellulosum TaxID=56 RepID=A0A2L0EIP2_SORCE|nr:uncharacterized protein SOCE26_005400 [Sorangium cellulosum]
MRQVTWCAAACRGHQVTIRRVISASVCPVRPSDRVAKLTQTHRLRERPSCLCPLCPLCPPCPPCPPCVVVKCSLHWCHVGPRAPRLPCGAWSRGLAVPRPCPPSRFSRRCALFVLTLYSRAQVFRASATGRRARWPDGQAVGFSSLRIEELAAPVAAFRASMDPTARLGRVSHEIGRVRAAGVRVALIAWERCARAVRSPCTLLSTTRSWVPHSGYRMRAGAAPQPGAHAVFLVEPRWTF